MQKGDSVILKNGQPAIYVGATSQQKAKHLVKLSNGEHKELTYKVDFFTQEDIDNKNAQKLASRKAAREEKNSGPIGISNKIRLLKNKLVDLENEMDEIYREQDLEVGGLEGGTDEFESTGQHNVYGSRLNSVQKKIDNINKQIKQLGGEQSYQQMSVEQVEELARKHFPESKDVKEAINLLESLTHSKIDLK